MGKPSRRRLQRSRSRSPALAGGARGAAVAAVAALALSSAAAAFAPTLTRQQPPAAISDAVTPRTVAFADIQQSVRQSFAGRPSVVRYMSDGVGGGLGDRPGGGGAGGGRGGNSNNDNMGGFLDREEEESDNLRAAREKISEDSLPLSFGFKKSEGGDGTSEYSVEKEDKIENPKADGNGGKLARSRSVDGAATALDLKDNPYLEVVSRLSPSDLISKFTTTAHPRVQDAVRSTILGLIGNLPKMAFDTTTITSGQRLASLMFQLQMTGYMFKNAEYRLSLAQSLGMEHMPNPEAMAKNGYLLEGTLSPHGEDEGEDDDSGIELGGKIKGKIRIKYGSSSAKEKAKDVKDKESFEDEEAEETSTSSGALGGMEIEVDADAYLSELRDEVSRLKEELMATRKSKDEAIKKDLLLYIRTMPREELASLTGTISPEVLSAMKGLVNVVMAGIGEGKIEADTITEQSGEAMAQLCMWQLVVGYNLRELEVREEMKAALQGAPLKDDGKDEKGRTWFGSG